MRSPLRSVRAALAAAALGTLSSGCVSLDPSEVCDVLACAPCAPPLTVKLTAETGGQVGEVSAEGEEVTCQDELGGTVCSVTRQEPGRYAFTLHAPGYAPLHVDEVVEGGDAVGCCACGYTPRRVELTANPS